MLRTRKVEGSEEEADLTTLIAAERGCRVARELHNQGTCGEGDLEDENHDPNRRCRYLNWTGEMRAIAATEA